MDPSSFFPIISGMLGGAASAGLFKGPIQTVEDWWYINFGHTSSEKAEMLRAKQNANIDAYKTSLLEEASKIDPANLKEPELKILGPALEASKYYIEDEPLRIMFAKLIASSMDSSKEDIVHSSYVEIIKQLTPLDAENLLSIHTTENEALICSLKKNYSTGGYDVVFSNLFLGNEKSIPQSRISPSLDNLSRLGLCEITYQELKIKEGIYDIFKETEEYHLLDQEIKRLNNEYDEIRRVAVEFPSSNIDADRVPVLSGPEIQKGLIRITPFGKNFCAICL
ncbi:MULTISPECIES: DUF4393 domain-containing protein [Enterococcus]|uniref:DUF4393 domain-containing protein n=1 Tax=Candidatus Enterococcus murrayae TaxID=2815321 RepID=A0ABS3HG73_9ENTE|nr:DUF4393 domain-containing protein [Enterococcus sp. MJM16]MBO0451949.1 DUF4393 domain-containing protein [Enterococcus sp. MJM16]